MNEEFAKLFGWIGTILERETGTIYDTGSEEYQIIADMKAGWNRKEYIELLRELDDKYGDKARETVGEFLKTNILKDWAAIGKHEAHDGTEIEDFIRVLWEPLKETGFEFDIKNDNNVFRLKVTVCPVFDLAEKTGMHEWFFQFACMGDYYTTSAFSNKIGFVRRNSLVQGDGFCDHTYFYKPDSSDRQLLGYCGLYCGNCPYYQETRAVAAAGFKKEDYYQACLGCNNDMGIRTDHCSTFCEVMLCAKEKGLDVCIDCCDFPCSIMEAFMHDKRYPYHKDVEKDMKYLKANGLTCFAEMMRDRYTCSNCSKVLNFFQAECDDCGTVVEK